MMSAPALAKASIYGSTGAIMRCTSNVFRECGRMARTTSGPSVMFGTKCPSITSIWNPVAPGLVHSADLRAEPGEICG